MGLPKATELLGHSEGDWGRGRQKLFSGPSRVSLCLS